MSVGIAAEDDVGRKLFSLVLLLCVCQCRTLLLVRYTRWYYFFDFDISDSGTKKFDGIYFAPTNWFPAFPFWVKNRRTARTAL